MNDGGGVAREGQGCPCWRYDMMIMMMLSKEVSSTILKVFGMMRPVIEPRFSGPLTYILPTRPMSRFFSVVAI